MLLLGFNILQTKKRRETIPTVSDRAGDSPSLGALECVSHYYLGMPNSGMTTKLVTHFTFISFQDFCARGSRGLKGQLWAWGDDLGRHFTIYQDLSTGPFPNPHPTPMPSHPQPEYSPL